MRCPACYSLFPVKPVVTSSLLERSVAAPSAVPAAPVAVNRTILAQTEAMIRYICPRCKKSMESPTSFAGQKLNCPDCNQRLQIPQPSKPPVAPAVNKTILAVAESASNPPPSATRPTPAVPPVPPRQVELVEQVTSPSESATRENCLECGVDITLRSRVQTCPDCGSLFCSAACYREHHYHAHARKEKRSSRPVECSYCGSNKPPHRTSQISPAGWIIFALLLVFFFPLCWIGLLMTESEYRCWDCGKRLD